jgi:hypothetical protein
MSMSNGDGLQVELLFEKKCSNAINVSLLRTFIQKK